MTLLLQQLIDGISSGAVYASMALALVLVFRCTGFLNFAQGEMALLSTYSAWQLTAWGVPVVLAIAAAAVLAFGFGVAVHQVVMRRFEGREEMTLVIVGLGLFLAFNQLATLLWGRTSTPMPSVFPEGSLALGDLRVPLASLGLMAVVAVEVLLLVVLVNRTRVGLAMRAVAEQRGGSLLVGVPVQRILLLGWGLAAVLGAVTGALVAPKLVLSPGMMLTLLIYALAGATLGGLTSPIGAVVGGLIVGVTENLAATYVGVIGSELKIAVPLLIIFLVLLVRPQGLFGRREVVRV